jgi:hypothetical protein
LKLLSISSLRLYGSKTLVPRGVIWELNIIERYKDWKLNNIADGSGEYEERKNGG